MPCGARCGTKPCTYCQQAGARACDRAAFREAVASFEQALQALAHLPEHGDTRVLAIDLRLALRIARCTHWESMGGASPCWARPRPWPRALDDRRPAGTGAGRDGRMYSGSTGDHDGAIAAGQQALALAAALGDSALQAQASHRLGQAYYAIGDFGRAAELLRRNVEAADRECWHAQYRLRASSPGRGWRGP